MRKVSPYISGALLCAFILSTSFAWAQSRSTGGRPQGSDFTAQAGSTLVQGNGTIGRIPRWKAFNGTNYILGDSVITESASGNIGIGNTSPASKLSVMGLIESAGAGGGIKFPDGTIQTTAAGGGMVSVAHDATLAGDGTPGSPLGLALPLIIEAPVAKPTPIFKIRNTADGGYGMEIRGGFSPDGDGGPGMFVNGGNSSSGDGGAGLFASGGSTFNGNGGTGLKANGGEVNLPGNGDGGTGVAAYGGTGRGSGHTAGDGIFAYGGIGSFGADNGFAGRFLGRVEVSGDFNVTSGTKNFKIDHPLDPENKYLYHAAIESSEVLNVYSGNVTTDEHGDAVVALPDWFEAINRDFRYQLTVVGTFAQAIVANKVKSNRFQIKTSAPNVEVSWQVTGIRSDRAMRMRPFKVEEEKPERERGYYLSPEAFDQPEERSVEWARNLQTMQRLKQQRIEAEQRGKP
jgi:hypothetical protein